MNSHVDCRDRTAEFFSTIQQIQKTQQQLVHGLDGSALASHRPLPKSSFASSSSSSGAYHNEFDDRPEESASLLRNGYGAPAPKQQSQFTTAAQHIGRSLHLVTEKLERLGKLARQRGLFNDPTEEINQLTYIIKTDLSTLQQELEVLHNWVLAHRDQRGNTGGADDHLSAQGARASTAIVDNLKQQLMSTTLNFQNVLQVRTNNLKEQNKQRTQFEAGGTSRATSSSSSAATSSLIAASGNAAVRKRGGNAFDQLMSAAASQKQSQLTTLGSGGGLETEAVTPDLLAPPDASQGGQQGQLLLAPSPVQADDYLTSRVEAVESIERTIHELGEMYKRLVHIVGMQEEVTLRIDDNITFALESTESGHKHLLDYYDRIKGSRWLILKVFAVLLAFLIFFMIFVA